MEKKKQVIYCSLQIVHRLIKGGCHSSLRSTETKTGWND